MNTPPLSEILTLSMQHLELVLITMAIAAAVGIPSAVFLARRPSARHPGQRPAQWSGGRLFQRWSQPKSLSRV